MQPEVHNSIHFDLPGSGSGSVRAQTTPPAPPESVQVRTEQELRAAGRDNILAALHATRWKVYGRGGAAELLGINPGTLAARIKKLGLRRP